MRQISAGNGLVRVATQPVGAVALLPESSGRKLHSKQNLLLIPAPSLTIRQRWVAGWTRLLNLDPSSSKTF